MTDKQKQMIRDMRLSGFKYAEIARTTGLSSNTVKSYCRRNKVDSPFNSVSTDTCEKCGRPLEHTPGAKPRRFWTMRRLPTSSAKSTR